MATGDRQGDFFDPQAFLQGTSAFRRRPTSSTTNPLQSLMSNPDTGGGAISSTTNPLQFLMSNPNTGAGGAAPDVQVDPNTAGAVSNTGGLTALSPVEVPGFNFTFKPPDLSAYDQQFQQSLAASRAGIANQFQRALEDIQAQEELSGELIQQLPGRFSDIFGTAEQRTGEFLSPLAQAAQDIGLGGQVSAEAIQAPLQAALQGGRSAFEASVPLLDIGRQQFFTGQKGGLEQARLGALAPLAAEERGFIGQQAGRAFQAGLEGERLRFQGEQEAARAAREEARFQRELAQDERQFQRQQEIETGGLSFKERQQFMTDEKIRLERSLQGLEPEEKDQVDQTVDAVLRTFDPADTSADRGAYIVMRSGKDFEAVQKDPDFKRAVDQIGKRGEFMGLEEPAKSFSSFLGVEHGSILPGGRGRAWEAEDVARALEDAGKHRSAAVIRHVYGPEEEKQARIAGLQTLVFGG